MKNSGEEIFKNLINLENTLLTSELKKFGDKFEIIYDILYLFENCFSEFHDEFLNSYIFYNGFKTHFILSNLSLIRKHKFEALINIRMMIEYIAQFSYCIYHNNLGAEKLNSIFDNKKHYGFFQENFTQYSNTLKNIKENIVNKNFAHSGYTTGFMNFDSLEMKMGFFDLDNEKIENFIISLNIDISINFLGIIMEISNEKELGINNNFMILYGKILDKVTK